jgi:putative transposase
MLNMTYEYKLEPTSEQVQVFDQWLETCRKVWNYALRERKDWYHSRSCLVNACSLRSEFIIPADAPRPTFVNQANALTKARQQIPELQAVHSQVLQQVLKQLEKAFTSMWESGFGFPRFKKTGRMRSFLFPQPSKQVVVGRYLKLPTIGKVKFRQSRPIPDGFSVKQIRVVKRASGYFAMLALACDVDVPTVMPHGHAVGIDLGLEKFLATSDGAFVPRPKFFVEAQCKLRLLQQRASRKQPGSKNWHKAQQKVARHHQRIRDSRKDFHFKTAHHLCDEAGMIFAENLNLKALSKGMLCKHILDAGFGQFLTILGYVCVKRGVFFLQVDANGTSQTCPKCHVITGKKELSQRVHHCPECGYKTHRDVAAAQVVRQRGLAAVGHTVKMLFEGKVIRLP